MLRSQRHFPLAVTVHKWKKYYYGSISCYFLKSIIFHKGKYVRKRQQLMDSPIFPEMDKHKHIELFRQNGIVHTKGWRSVETIPHQL